MFDLLRYGDPTITTTTTNPSRTSSSGSSSSMDKNTTKASSSAGSDFIDTIEIVDTDGEYDSTPVSSPKHNNKNTKKVRVSKMRRTLSNVGDFSPVQFHFPVMNFFTAGSPIGTMNISTSNLV